MYKGIIILTVIAASSAQYLRNECPSDSSALLLPHLTDCSKYYKCSNGDKIETNCPTGALFDSDLQGCSLAIFVTCAPGATAPVSDELLSFAIDCSDLAVKMLLPHDSDCERYYKCDNGKKIDMFCSPGAAFDFMAQDCHEGVTCTTTSVATTTTTETTTTVTTTTEPTTTTTSTTTTATAPPTTKSSPSTYLLPHEGDCSKYYKCVKGEKVAMECSPGTAFDFNTQACSIGATCTLSAANEPPATETESTTTPAIITTPVDTTTPVVTTTPVITTAATTTTISTTVTDEPTTVFLSTIEITTGFLRIQAGLEFLPNGCPVEPETEPPPVNNMIFIDYYLPHDSQCSKYYRCVGGNKVEKDCSPGTWFDVNSQACKNPATVICANQEEVPLTTTEATPPEITTTEISSTETPTTETSTTETSTTETSTTETTTTSAELTTTEYLTTDIPTTIVVTTDNITVYNEIPTENIFTTVIITRGLSLNEYLRAQDVQYLPNGCPIRPRIKGRPGRPRVVKKVPGRPKIKKPVTKPTTVVAESTMQDITISEDDITTTPHEFFSAEECNDVDCNNVEETSPQDYILTTNVEESESGADDLESNPEASDSEAFESVQENSTEEADGEMAVTVSVNAQETVDSSTKVEETYTVAADLPELSIPVQEEIEQTVLANDQVVEEDSVTQAMIEVPNIMLVNLPLEEIVEEFSDQTTIEELAITTVASPEEETEKNSQDEHEPENGIIAGSDSETEAAEGIIVLGVDTSTTLSEDIETLFETAGVTEGLKEEASVSTENLAPEAEENMEAVTPLEESKETLPVTDQTAEEGSVIEEVNEVEETELQENKVPVVENSETISESGVVDGPISAEEPSVLPVNLLADIAEDQEPNNLETVVEESESETADLFVESISETAKVSDNTKDMLGEESLEILPVTDHTVETESGTESVNAVTENVTETLEESLVEDVETVSEDVNEAESADVQPIVLPVNLSPEDVAEDVKEKVSENEPTIEEESETEADLLVESITKAKETFPDQTTESFESVSEPMNDEYLQESVIGAAKLPVETIPEATEKSLTEAITEEQLVSEPIEAQQGEETQVPDEVQALISKTTNSIVPYAETITTAEIDVNAEEPGIVPVNLSLEQAVDVNPTAVTESDEMNTEGSEIQTASELSEDISETTEISLIEQTETKDEEPGIVPVNLPLEEVADEDAETVLESYEISTEDVATATIEPLPVVTKISLVDETLIPQSVLEPIKESVGGAMVETLSVIDQSTVEGSDIEEFNDMTIVILETTEALLVDSEFVPETVSITEIDELAVEPAIVPVNILLEETLDETTELESESDQISVENVGTATVIPMEDETKQPESVSGPTEESLGVDITETVYESQYSTAETEEIGDAAEMIIETTEASQLDEKETKAAEDTQTEAVSLLTESVPESTETSLGEESLLSVSVAEPSEDSLGKEFNQNDESVTTTEGLETYAADEMSEAIFETTIMPLTEAVPDTDTSQELGIVPVNLPFEEAADETTKTKTESDEALTERSESYLLGEPISEPGESAIEQIDIAPLEEIAEETTTATSENYIDSTKDSETVITDSISEPIPTTMETALEEDNVQSELMTEHTLVELQTDGEITETMSKEVHSESSSQAADEEETTAVMLENTDKITEMPEIAVTEFDGTTEKPGFVAVNLPLEEAVDESTLAESSGTEVDLITEPEPTSGSTDTNFVEENKQQIIPESTIISIEETDTDELLGNQSTTEKEVQVLEDISKTTETQLTENTQTISETETEGIIEQIDLVIEQGMDETTTFVPEGDQEIDQITTADGETEKPFVTVNLPLEELIDETASEMFETEQVSSEWASIVTTNLANTNTALDEENEQQDSTEKSDEEITKDLLVESEQSTAEGSDSGIFEDDYESTTILGTETSDSETELISEATEAAVGGETEQAHFIEKADEKLTTELLFESDQFSDKALETQAADISETTETLLNENTETVAVATSDIVLISSPIDEPGFVAVNLPLEDMADENTLPVSEGDQITTEAIDITTELLSEATNIILGAETEQSQSTENSEEEVSTDSLLGSDLTTVESSETQVNVEIFESDIVSTDVFETESTDLTTESISDATVTILGDKIEQTDSTEKSDVEIMDDAAEGSKTHADSEIIEDDTVATDMSETEGSSSITESISGATETHFKEETYESELTEVTTDSLLESGQTTTLTLETQADAEVSEGDYVPSEMLGTEDTQLTTESIAVTAYITLEEETKQTESTEKPDEGVTTDSLSESDQTTIEGSETNADNEISESVSIEMSETEGSSLITESISDAETTFRQETEESESTIKSDEGETLAEGPEIQGDSEISDDIPSTIEAMVTENTETVIETDFDTEISGSTNEPGFVAVNVPLEDIILENTKAVSDGDQVSTETTESLSEATYTALGDETGQSESTQTSDEGVITDSFFESDQTTAKVSETPVDAESSLGDISTETLETITFDLTTDSISGAIDNTLEEETEQTESTEKISGELITDSIFESDEKTTESSETQAEGLASEGDNISTKMLDTGSSTLESITEATETSLEEVTEQTVPTERSDEDITTGLLLESDQITAESSETQADNEISEISDTTEPFLDDVTETELETATDTTISYSNHTPGFVAVNIPVEDKTDGITVPVLDSDQASTNTIGTEASDSTTESLTEAADTSLGEDTEQSKSTEQLGEEVTTDSLLESEQSMTEGSETIADIEISGDITETTVAFLNEVTGTDGKMVFNTEITGAPDELPFVAVNLPLEDSEDETTEAVSDGDKDSTITLETQETDPTTLGGGNEQSEFEEILVETTTDLSLESDQTTSHDSETRADTETEVISTEILESEASDSTIEPITLTTISEVNKQPVSTENSDEEVTINSLVETGGTITESLEIQPDAETSEIMETEETEWISEAAGTTLNEEAEQTESTDKSEDKITTDSAVEDSETHTSSDYISIEIVEIEPSKLTTALISDTNTVLGEEAEHTDVTENYHVEVTTDTIFENDQITDVFLPVNLQIEDISDETTVSVSGGDQGSTETLELEATDSTIEPSSEATNNTLGGATAQSDENVTTETLLENKQTTTERSETQAEEETFKNDNVSTDMLGTEESELITASTSETPDTALGEETEQTKSSGNPIEEVTTDTLLESDQITAEDTETQEDVNFVSTKIMETVALETTSEPISWATYTSLGEETAKTESSENSDEPRPTDLLLNGYTDVPGFVAVNLLLDDLSYEMTSPASDLVSTGTLEIADTDSKTEIGLADDTKQSEPTQQSDEDVTTDSLLESDQTTTEISETQADKETSEMSELETSESITALLSQTTNIDLGEETQYTEFTKNLYEEVTTDSFLESDQTMVEGKETQTDGDTVSTEVMEMEVSESTTQTISEAKNTVLQEQTVQSSSEKSNEEITTDSLLDDATNELGFVAVNLPLEDLVNETASTVSNSDQVSTETLGLEAIDSTTDLSMLTDVALGDGTEQLGLTEQSDEEVTTESWLESDETTTESSETQADEETSGSENISTDMLGTKAFESTTHSVSETMNTVLEVKTEQTESTENPEEKVSSDLFLENDQTTAEDSETQADGDNVSTDIMETDAFQTTLEPISGITDTTLGEEIKQTGSTENLDEQVTTDSLLNGSTDEPGFAVVNLPLEDITDDSSEAVSDGEQVSTKTVGTESTDSTSEYLSESTYTTLGDGTEQSKSMEQSDEEVTTDLFLESDQTTAEDSGTQADDDNVSIEIMETKASETTLEVISGATDTTLGEEIKQTGSTENLDEQVTTDSLLNGSTDEPGFAVVNLPLEDSSEAVSDGEQVLTKTVGTESTDSTSEYLSESTYTTLGDGTEQSKSTEQSDEEVTTDIFLENDQTTAEDLETQANGDNVSIEIMETKASETTLEAISGATDTTLGEEIKHTESTENLDEQVTIDSLLNDEESSEAISDGEQVSTKALGTESTDSMAELLSEATDTTLGDGTEQSKLTEPSDEEVTIDLFLESDQTTTERSETLAYEETTSGSDNVSTEMSETETSESTTASLRETTNIALGEVTEDTASTENFEEEVTTDSVLESDQTTAGDVETQADVDNVSTEIMEMEAFELTTDLTTDLLPTGFSDEPGFEAVNLPLEDLVEETASTASDSDHVSSFTGIESSESTTERLSVVTDVVLGDETEQSESTELDDVEATTNSLTEDYQLTADDSETLVDGEASEGSGVSTETVATDSNTEQILEFMDTTMRYTEKSDEEVTTGSILESDQTTVADSETKPAAETSKGDGVSAEFMELEVTESTMEPRSEAAVTTLEDRDQTFVEILESQVGSETSEEITKATDALLKDITETDLESVSETEISDATDKPGFVAVNLPLEDIEYESLVTVSYGEQESTEIMGAQETGLTTESILEATNTTSKNEITTDLFLESNQTTAEASETQGDDETPQSDNVLTEVVVTESSDSTTESLSGATDTTLGLETEQLEYTVESDDKFTTDSLEGDQPTAEGSETQADSKILGEVSETTQSLVNESTETEVVTISDAEISDSTNEPSSLSVNLEDMIDEITVSVSDGDLVSTEIEGTDSTIEPLSEDTNTILLDETKHSQSTKKNIEEITTASLLESDQSTTDYLETETSESENVSKDMSETDGSDSTTGLIPEGTDAVLGEKTKQTQTIEKFDVEVFTDSPLESDQTTEEDSETQAAGEISEGDGVSTETMAFEATDSSMKLLSQATDITLENSHKIIVETSQIYNGSTEKMETETSNSTTELLLVAIDTFLGEETELPASTEKSDEGVTTELLLESNETTVEDSATQNGKEIPGDFSENTEALINDIKETEEAFSEAEINGSSEEPGFLAVNLPLEDIVDEITDLTNESLSDTTDIDATEVTEQLESTEKIDEGITTDLTLESDQSTVESLESQADGETSAEILETTEVLMNENTETASEIISESESSDANDEPNLLAMNLSQEEAADETTASFIMETTDSMTESIALTMETSIEEATEQPVSAEEIDEELTTVSFIESEQSTVKGAETQAEGETSTTGDISETTEEFFNKTEENTVSDVEISMSTGELDIVTDNLPLEGVADETISEDSEDDQLATIESGTKASDLVTESLAESTNTVLEEETEKSLEDITTDSLLVSEQSVEGSETLTADEVETSETETVSVPEIIGSTVEPDFIASNLPLEEGGDNITLTISEDDQISTVGLGTEGFNLVTEPLPEATDSGLEEDTDKQDIMIESSEETTTELILEGDQSTTEGIKSQAADEVSEVNLDTEATTSIGEADSATETITVSEIKSTIEESGINSVNLPQEAMMMDMAQEQVSENDQITSEVTESESVDSINEFFATDTILGEETVDQGTVSEPTQGSLGEESIETNSENEQSTAELPTCPGGYVGNMPHPDLCNFFYKCDGGEESQLTPCDDGFEFNPEAEECFPIAEGGCTLSMTTTIGTKTEVTSDSADFTSQSTVIVTESEEIEEEFKPVETEGVLDTEATVIGSQTETVADETLQTEAEANVDVVETKGTVEEHELAESIQEAPASESDQTEESEKETTSMSFVPVNLPIEMIVEGAPDIFGEAATESESEISGVEKTVELVEDATKIEAITEGIDIVVGDEDAIVTDSTDTNKCNVEGDCSTTPVNGEESEFEASTDQAPESVSKATNVMIEENVATELAVIQEIQADDVVTELASETDTEQAPESVPESTDVMIEENIATELAEVQEIQADDVITELASKSDTELVPESVSEATNVMVEENDATELAVVQEIQADDVVTEFASEIDTEQAPESVIESTDVIIEETIATELAVVQEIPADDVVTEFASEVDTEQAPESLPESTDVMIEENIATELAVVQEIQADDVVTEVTSESNTELVSESVSEATNVMIEENIATELAVVHEIQADDVVKELASETDTEQAPVSVPDSTEVIIEENIATELAVLQEIQADDVVTKFASETDTEQAPESVTESTDVMIDETIATELTVVQEIQADDVVTELASETDTEQAPISVPESTDVMIEENIATELAEVQEIHADDVITELALESDTELAPDSVSEATNVMIEENVATELAVVQEIQADDVVTEFASETSTEQAPESVTESTDVMIDETIATELAVVQEIQADDAVTELALETDIEQAPVSVPESTDVMIEENIATELAVVQEIHADDIVTELALESDTELAPESVSEATNVMIEENVATELAVVQEIQADDVVTEFASETSTKQAPESVTESTDVIVEENIATELAVVQEIEADDIVTELASESDTELAPESVSEATNVMIEENVATELAVVQEIQADDIVTELASESDTELAPESVSEATNVMIEENVATELAVIQEIQADDVVTELASETDTEQAPESVPESTDVMIEENIATELAEVQEIQADDVITELASKSDTELVPESVSEATNVMVEENDATELAVVQEIQADDVVTEFASEIDTEQAPESVTESTDVLIDETFATELAVVHEIQADDVVTEFASEIDTEQAPESLPESTDVMIDETIATELAVVQEIPADDVVTELASETDTEQAPVSVPESTDVMIEENIATELAVVHEIHVDDVVTELTLESDTELASESVSEATNVMIEENIATELAVVQEIQADDVVAEFASETSTEQAPESVTEVTNILVKENVATELAVIQKIQSDDYQEIPTDSDETSTDIVLAVKESEDTVTELPSELAIEEESITQTILEANQAVVDSVMVGENLDDSASNSPESVSEAGESEQVTESANTSEASEDKGRDSAISAPGIVLVMADLDDNQPIEPISDIAITMGTMLDSAVILEESNAATDSPPELIPEEAIENEDGSEITEIHEAVTDSNDEDEEETEDLSEELTTETTTTKKRVSGQKVRRKTTSSTTTVAPTETTTDPPICPDGYVGNMPHPDLCNYYYQCEGAEEPIMTSCDDGFEFDDNTKECIVSEGGCIPENMTSTDTIPTTGFITPIAAAETKATLSEAPVTKACNDNDGCNVDQMTETNTEVPETEATEIQTVQTTAITEATITEITTVSTKIKKKPTKLVAKIRRKTTTTTTTPPPTTTPHPVCPYGYDGKMADPEICNYYHKCDGFGNQIMLACDDGFEFDSTTHECVPTVVGGSCVPEIPPTTPAPSTQTPKRKKSGKKRVQPKTTSLIPTTTRRPICPIGYVGNVGHAGLCNYFFKCDGSGNPNLTPCADGYEFSLRKRDCVLISESGDCLPEDIPAPDPSKQTNETNAEVSELVYSGLKIRRKPKPTTTTTTTEPTTTEELTTTEESLCPTGFVGNIAHPELCSFFYMCDGTGVPVLTPCEEELEFDPGQEICVPISEEGCSSGTKSIEGEELNTTPSMGQTTESSTNHPPTTEPTTTLPTTTEELTTLAPKCEPGFTGNIAHTKKCNQFFICASGEPLIMFCSTGEEFDPVMKICVEIRSGGCTFKKSSDSTETSPTTEIKSSINENTNTEPSRRTSNEFRRKMDFSCLVGMFDSVPDPGQCNAFFMCSDRMVLHLYCPRGYEFDPYTKVCVSISQFGCSARSALLRSLAEQVSPHHLNRRA